MEWSPQQAAALKVNEARFYVYEHLIPGTGIVFYVGKGTRGRATTRQGRNQRWHEIAHRLGFEVRITARSIDEDLAYLVERELIDLRRRSGHSLVNITDGGEDFSAGMWLDLSVRSRHQTAQVARWGDAAQRSAQSERIRAAYARPELRARIGSSVRLALADPVTKEKQRAGIARVKRTDQARAATAEQTRARMADPMQRQRAREAGRAAAVMVHCLETGQTFNSIADAAAWLRGMSHVKATDAAIVHACSGRRKSAYGYRWQRVNNTAVTRAAETVTVVI